MKLPLLLVSCTLFALLIASTHAKTIDAWKPRVIYQILTDRFAKSNPGTEPCRDFSGYCGGTWKGIQNNLGYLTDLGVDAIWISPMVKNTPGGYHGFWLEDLTKVNEHFGTEQDLINLIRECHKRNIFVMLDVVANHVGPVGYNYTSIVQFDKQSHYHNCDGCPADCEIHNWGASNQYEVEHCRLSGLPDLNQTDPFVRQTLLAWIKSTVSKYDFDGIRIDTVPEIDKAFWNEFATAAGVFQIGEVFDGNIGYVAGYQPPLQSLFSYPLYFTMKGVYGYKNSMYGLRDTIQGYNQFHDASVLGTFIDNHDNARFLNFQKDYNLYKAALAFTLYSNGIPVIYYGTEQGFAGGNDPDNREPLWTTGFSRTSPLYQYLSKIISWRKQYQIWKFPQIERYVDDSFYAFTRGDVFVATTNVGSNGGQINRKITYHPYSVGTTVCNLFWPGDCVPVTQSGFNVVLNNGETKIYVPSQDAHY